MENNDSSNPALASRSHSQGVPRWPPLTHRSNTVKTIGKSTFSGGGGGATRSRKRIHLGVAGKSYGFRKIMGNYWKNNISRDLALAANRDFLPAMTLPIMKKGLQQMKNLSFFGLPGLDREHFRTAACKANPSKDTTPRLPKKKKTAISLPTDVQT